MGKPDILSYIYGVAVRNSDADGKGNYALHIVVGINLDFLLEQDNSYFGVVGANYAQYFGPADILGNDAVRFFPGFLHKKYNLSGRFSLFEFIFKKFEKQYRQTENGYENR
ncbi:hypothetical protein ACRFAY_15900 [Bacteroides hominis]|uniref:hypothetical protein n=1 Tax=Bacteroides TaxID=816 RepID=UPI001898F2B3|nr:MULTISPECIES: hypothetical protein [Bacteroides]MCE8625926.1 hypothetical protein [Bacteroides fragilis]MCE8699165.1 hypothetical protein [Bacteroides fragilis]MCE8703862.1 hypothetical protein [Bacteroides fragilis]MCE9326603.1 hypothetical protein [Bacteroides fragilis]MCE9448337.1 hypothetical protein [Bacteroides fragilis]